MTDDLLVFTVRSAAGLIGLICMLRFLLSPHRSGVFAPTYEIFSKMSNWLVRPFSRFLPLAGGYETAPFFVAWVCYSVGKLAVMGIQGTELTDDLQLYVSAALIFGMAQVLKIIVYIVIAVVIIHVLYSWINPSAPMAYIFRAFADRILGPFRRFVPPVGSIDLSPIVVIFLAQALLIVIAHLERHITLAL